MTTARTPIHVRLARRFGQQAVLYAALGLSAPGEYSLARMAGWSDYAAYLMPAVMSLYAAIGASVAKAQTEAARRAVGTPGEAEARRRARNATTGALLALFLATAAQITDHILTADATGARLWVLVAVSAVPPLVAAHVLHIDPPTELPVVDEPREAHAESPQGPAGEPAEGESEESGMEATKAAHTTVHAPSAPTWATYRGASEALGVAESTVRGWAANNKISKKVDSATGMTVVNLVDCQQVGNKAAA